ncbi:MAG: hypothetical protein ACFFCS_20930 [Candidatus Hodarchaeota archaeon]
MAINFHILKIKCPECAEEQEISASTELVKNNVKGISTIAVQSFCGHSFHVFVDTTYQIRGYQRSDVDLFPTVPKGQTYVDVSLTEYRMDFYEIPLSAMVILLSDEPFSLIVRAFLLGKTAILVHPDQQLLKSLFINFFALFQEAIANGETGTLEIMDANRFKNFTIPTLQTDLIVDLDTVSILSNPFKGKKPKVEKSILKQALSKGQNEQKEFFKEAINKIYFYVFIIMEYIQGGMRDWKVIKQKLNKRIETLGEKAPSNVIDLAWEIAQRRSYHIWAKKMKDGT